MNTKRLPSRVVVTTALGVDACLVERGDDMVLLLRPHQTFGAAVTAVRAVLPELDHDRARKLIRQHLPTAMDLEEVLLEGQVEAPLPPPEYPWVAGLVVLVVALVAFALILIVGEAERQESLHQARVKCPPATLCLPRN